MALTRVVQLAVVLQVGSLEMLCLAGREMKKQMFHQKVPPVAVQVQMKDYSKIGMQIVLM